MSSLKINDFAKEVYANARQKGFYDEVNSTELITHLFCEVAEVAEELRAGHRPDLIYYNYDKPEGVPAELADVVLMVCSIAEHFNIDLEGVIEEKFRYSKTRPRKHGKQF